MAPLDPPDRPHRVAVVGAGPAGFYTIQALFDQSRSGALRIDLIERLPAPYGLVRYGVAPDHEKIKRVTAVYDRLASDSRCRYFGNVEIGRDLTLDELLATQDQVVLCTGAQGDRTLDIPGVGLRGSHSATEFVASYNGHPDHADDLFDLAVERAAVIGVGNVALDVARILMSDPRDLETTDIAEPALNALRGGRIRECYVLGRRGPAQAAFTPAEVRELGLIRGLQVLVNPEEIDHAAGVDRMTRMKLESLARFAVPPDPKVDRRIKFRFGVSPIELHGDATGRVVGLTLAHNEGVAQAMTRTERLDVGLVIRAVGYRGVPVAGAPFDECRGTIPSENGRVLDRPAGDPVPRLYVAGWIKRGPSGVLGTNKPDASETVRSMSEDREASSGTGAFALDLVPLLECRGIRFVSWEDWRILDAIELEHGRRAGRVRSKFLRREEFLAALGTG